MKIQICHRRKDILVCSSPTSVNYQDFAPLAFICPFFPLLTYFNTNPRHDVILPGHISAFISKKCRDVSKMALSSSRKINPNMNVTFKQFFSPLNKMEVCFVELFLLNSVMDE